MATGGETQGSNYSLELWKELSYKFVMEIKDDLSSVVVICEDLFGKVYKGVVRDDNEVLAVKKLELSISDATIFEDEVRRIMVLKHDNIVDLIGFCTETKTQIGGKFVDADASQRLLCYQYLPKGSLHSYLFGSKAAGDSSSVKPSISQRDWESRFKIVKGICQGLHFLHKSGILHMNLKLENIWLDETMVPKIMNVGLSGLFGQELTKSYTEKESVGYMAPEYLSSNGKTSASCIDVYSLGVMIIQIATGDKICGNTDDPASRKYIDQTRRHWTAEHIAATYRPFDAECLHQVHVCIKTGLECVQIDERNRPSIDVIVDRLNTI